MRMNIAILTGEVSGDLIGGALAKELRRQCPSIELWGMGSSSMREAGVELVVDSSIFGTISITEALRNAPSLLFQVKPRIKAALRERKPDVVVPIDFGFFNVRVAAEAKRLGSKVCYYFPPGSWRRTSTKGAGLPAITDLIACPFPWTAERLGALGANTLYVGHPMLERLTSIIDRAALAAKFGIDPNRPIIGLLPGSRTHEITHIFPLQLKAARLLLNHVPDAQFIVGVAPGISPESLIPHLSRQKEIDDRAPQKNISDSQRQMITPEGLVLSEREMKDRWKARIQPELPTDFSKHTQLPIVLATGMTTEILANSDALVMCSGTATLEAAVFGTPMVVVYRGSKIMEAEAKLRGIRKHIPMISLPNIIADRKIVTELIMDEATPERVAEELLPLLNDPVRRNQMRQDLRTVKEALGEPGASEKTARAILELAAQGRVNR